MQAQGPRVVTPEAVVLDVRTAGLGSRTLARVLDSLVQFAVIMAAFLLVTFVAGLLPNGSLGPVVLFGMLGFVTAVVVGYPIAWETLWRGRTPGKAAMGLRVVTRQGGPIRFRHAAVRGVLGLGEVTLLPVIAVVAMLVSPSEQRLGDMAAGTIVILERSAGGSPQPVVFYPPPGFERFVESIDVSGMSAAEYQAVRAFLLRARSLNASAREDLAVRLALPLASRLHQPVPSGVGPELWLACTAAAYQQRYGGPWPPARPPGPTWGPPSAAGPGLGSPGWAGPAGPRPAGWAGAPPRAGWVGPASGPSPGPVWPDPADPVAGSAATDIAGTAPAAPATAGDFTPPA